MYTFLDIINVERTFHYETHFVKKKITITNYKNERGNFHDSFLIIKFCDYKINIFVLHFGDGGEGQKKGTFCTLVRLLINVKSP